MADKFNTLAETSPYGGKYVTKRKEQKADQTKNVKRLTTSNDAYSPETMYKSYGTKNKIRGVKEVPEGTAGANYFSKLTDYEKSKVMDDRARRKRRPVTKGKSQNTRPPQDLLKGSLRRKIKKFAGGGMSQRGLGRAFMKGGKV